MLLRIQLSKNEPEEACDEKTLQAWVRSGKIQAHHLIWSQEQQIWIQAKKWPSLQGLFSSSLWEAWDSNDDWELDPDIETGIRERIKKQDPSNGKKQANPKKTPKLPLSAIEPITKTETDKIQPQKSPKKSVKQVRVQEVIPKYIPQRMKNNEIIETKTLIESWNPEVSLQDQPQFWAEEEPKKKGVSTFRIGLIVVLGLVPLLGYREWFISEATLKYPLEEEVEMLQKGDNSAVDLEKQKGIIDLEKELKSSLRTDIQEVNLKHSFSDALLIEMTYVDLDVKKITADVLSWKGRRLDVPKSASIQVNLNSSGEVDRELALVSMIIAKYTEHYTLDIDSFSIILYLEDARIQKEIAVPNARNLLLRPGALPQFLETIVD